MELGDISASLTVVIILYFLFRTKLVSCNEICGNFKIQFQLSFCQMKTIKFEV